MQLLSGLSHLTNFFSTKNYLTRRRAQHHCLYFTGYRLTEQSKGIPLLEDVEFVRVLRNRAYYLANYSRMRHRQVDGHRWGRRWAGAHRKQTC